MSEMDALLAKLEAAKEGSRELDAEIHWEMFPLEPGPDPLHYTTSLDAALTLVPEGFWASNLRTYHAGGKPWGYCAELRTGGPRREEGLHVGEHRGSLSLAICIAALKASSQSP